MTEDKDNWVWIDMEMTGLDPNKERIIELATVVTDTNLNIVAQGPALAVHQSDELLDAMDEWNQSHHGSSGLIKKVKASKISESMAEEQTIAFLSGYVEVGRSPMCGNTIWQDRRFLSRYMPKLEAFFHYRMLDVSSVKEMAKRWAPAVYDGVRKELKHTALSDVIDSINELKHYRENLVAVEFRQAMQAAT